MKCGLGTSRLHIYKRNRNVEIYNLYNLINTVQKRYNNIFNLHVAKASLELMIKLKLVSFKAGKETVRVNRLLGQRIYKI